jgi:exonuclease VII small subunit
LQLQLVTDLSEDPKSLVMLYQNAVDTVSECQRTIAALEQKVRPMIGGMACLPSLALRLTGG